MLIVELSSSFTDTSYLTPMLRCVICNVLNLSMKVYFSFLSYRFQEGSISRTKRGNKVMLWKR